MAATAYKQRYLAAEARASAAERELGELRQQLKVLQAEQARAARLPNDGTDAGELRAKLAEAQAENDRLQRQACGGTRQQDGGMDWQAKYNAEADEHKATLQRLSDTSKELEKARQEIEERSNAMQESAGAIRELTAERDALAAEVKRLKAAQGGRPKKFDASTAERVKALRAEGKSLRAIQTETGASTGTIRRMLAGGA